MNLRAHFPKASASFIAANPVLFPDPAATESQPAKQNALAELTARRGRMNKTESEFALILESYKRRDKIIRWEFEGITLRWAGMRYTPDFTVIKFGGLVTFIEVKGGHIWSRDLVRFKGAANYWPEFAFEFWQKQNGHWLQRFTRR